MRAAGTSRLGYAYGRVPTLPTLTQARTTALQQDNQQLTTDKCATLSRRYRVLSRRREADQEDYME